MDDDHRTREEILLEVESLRRRVAALEADGVSTGSPEAVLRRERDRAQRYLDVAGVMIVVIRPDQTVEMINQKGCEILGRREDEIVGRNWFETFIPERLVPQVKSVFDQIVHGQLAPVEYYENPVVTRGGEERLIAWHNALLTDTAGAVVGVLGSGEDITERRAAVEALEQERQRFRELAAMLPQTVYEADLRGTLTFINRAAYDFFGYTEREFETGLNIAQMLVPEERERAAANFAARLQGEELPDHEYTAMRKDGSRFPVLIYNSVRRRAGRLIGVRGIVLDITRQRRAEEERRQLEVRLRHQQKLESIGTLAGGVAHEINNPINGIMNYAQLILDSGEQDAEVREFAGEIIRESERVATIVRNLLSFARQEKSSHSPARMCDIVADALSLIGTIIRRDQITLEAVVPEDLPRIRCRSQQIQQVLMNLMTNSRDALNLRYPGHDPEKIIRVTVEPVDMDGRRWIRTTVEDHGTGIEPEVCERMFDPFFTTKGRAEGTGLGLAISHSIVQEHGGELTVESDVGAFTRFHLVLPADSTPEGEESGG